MTALRQLLEAHARSFRGCQTGSLDVGPDMLAVALHDYLTLWDKVTQIQLVPKEEDSLRWAWEKDGQYSTRSAYAARFWGREIAPAATFTWESKVPLKCRFFAWLALQDRCWTSDRLAQ